MERLVQRHLPKGVLVDTNLLLLFFVGLYDQNWIEKFKRTQRYTPDDFLLLRALIVRFSQIVVTPYILAELSNLSMQMPESVLGGYFECLARALARFKEEHVAKDALLSPAWLKVLSRIGFTDLSLIEAAKKGNYLVLTDDFRAAEFLRAAECSVINLNHIRGFLWLRE